MGNGGDWKNKPGYQTTHEAKTGYAISFSPGQAGADRTYGHVAIVEDVKEDGSIPISESNVLGLGKLFFEKQKVLSLSKSKTLLSFIRTLKSTDFYHQMDWTETNSHSNCSRNTYL
ncbi:TPA: CHAP domain-containing protein [Streptococcus agalactiae]